MMQVSAAGRALIERYEGRVLHTYYDTRGIPTIGYGCTGPEASPGRVITQAEADAMLSDRLGREFEPGVSAAIGSAPTTQAQFDAMVSLAFNIGVGAPGGKGGFVNSSVCRLHREGNYLGAADAFTLYVMSGGQYLEPLHRRRLEEEKLYLSDLPKTGAAAAAPAPAAASQPAADPIALIKAAQLLLGTDGDGDPGPETRRLAAAWRARTA